jgi:hypothetical protein
LGTFHSDKGPLHGITVVVDTVGPRVWVGRCDTVLPEGVVLLDADCHDEGAEGVTNADWLLRAARLGVWSSHPRTLVPASEVREIRRLSDLA